MSLRRRPLIAANWKMHLLAPDVRERIIGISVEVDYRRTAEFTRYLKDQQARFADIIKKGNIKIE